MKALRIKISNYVTKKAMLPLAITAATLGIGLNNQAYGQEDMMVIKHITPETKEYVVQTMFDNFDKDKFPDEVEITRTENSNQINIYFFKGDGKGHFTHKDEKKNGFIMDEKEFTFIAPNEKIELKTNESYQIFPVDYNGDGAVDLIIRRINSENSTRDYPLKNNGDGTFTNFYEKKWEKMIEPTKKINWNTRQIINYKYD